MTNHSLRARPVRRSCTRLASGVLILCAVLTAGCESLRLGPAAQGTADGWVTEGASDQRDHWAADAPAPPLGVSWRYNAAAAFGPAPVVTVGGLVLVANRKGEIHAIDLETGDRRGLREFGDAVEGAPAVRDGTLFVPIMQGKYKLVAYDLVNGQYRWRVKGDPIPGGVLLSGEQVVVVDMFGKVRAFDQKSGQVIWEHELGKKASASATPIRAGDYLIVADEQGDVAALEPATGSVVWQARLGSPVYATPSASNHHIFVPTTRGRLVALRAADGAVAWTYAAADTTVRLASPAVGGEEVVVGGSDGTLRSFDAASGALRWSHTVDEALTAAPLITTSNIYIGTMGRRLLAFDRSSGRLVWETELEGRVKTALAAERGRIIVLSEPRFVYSFSSEARDIAESN